MRAARSRSPGLRFFVGTTRALEECGGTTGCRGCIVIGSGEDADDADGAAMLEFSPIFISFPLG